MSGTTTTTRTGSALEVETVTGEASLVVSSGQGPTARARRDLASYERGILHYPEAIRDRVRWLIGYWLEKCQGSHSALRAIGCKAGWDKSDEYYYNLLGGYNFKTPTGSWKEGGKAWGEFMEIYAAVRRYAEQAERQGRVQFIETPTYHCIANFITARRALNAVCKFGGIMHPTGAQSTACIKHYVTLNNHGAVTRVECPANKRLSTLQTKVAANFKVNESDLRLGYKREAAIRDNVNESRTIIFDNAQNLYIDGKGWDQPMFNWLLELQEDTGFTPILNFTTDFADKLTAGRAAGYFEQFVGRMGGMKDVLTLPDYMPDADLRCIARAFGVKAEAGIEMMSKWSRQQGRCRILFQRLQRAQEFARLDGRDRITVADLQEAHDYTPPAIGSDNQGEE